MRGPQLAGQARRRQAAAARARRRVWRPCSCGNGSCGRRRALRRTTAVPAWQQLLEVHRAPAAFQHCVMAATRHPPSWATAQRPSRGEGARAGPQSGAVPWWQRRRLPALERHLAACLLRHNHGQLTGLPVAGVCCHRLPLPRRQAARVRTSHTAARGRTVGGAPVTCSSIRCMSDRLMPACHGQVTPLHCQPVFSRGGGYLFFKHVFRQMPWQL